MPRYVYYCSQCDGHFQVRHGMREVQKLCQLCESADSLQRVPQMPNIKKESHSRNKSAGSLTKDFIEQNRELLRDMKKEARSQEYDD